MEGSVMVSSINGSILLNTLAVEIGEENTQFSLTLRPSKRKNVD